MQLIEDIEGNLWLGLAAFVKDGCRFLCLRDVGVSLVLFRQIFERELVVVLVSEAFIGEAHFLGGAVLTSLGLGLSGSRLAVKLLLPLLEGSRQIQFLLPMLHLIHVGVVVLGILRAIEQVSFQIGIDTLSKFAV